MKNVKVGLDLENAKPILRVSDDDDDDGTFFFFVDTMYIQDDIAVSQKCIILPTLLLLLFENTNGLMFGRYMHIYKYTDMLSYCKKSCNVCDRQVL